MERLDYIIAISEEQNITKAAKRLFISQPALTKYINKIEKEYGVTLFDRSHSPITLTNAGKLFLSEKIKIELAERELRSKLLSLQNGKICLSIGTGHSRIQNWMPPLLEAFCAVHPDIGFSLISSGELALPRKLQHGEIDLAIGAFSTTELSGFSLCSLTREDLRLLVPISFGLFPPDFSVKDSLLHPYILDPQHLNQQNLISAGRNMGSYYNYQLLMQQYHIIPRREIIADSICAIKKLIQLGLGYGYVSVRNLADLQGQDGQYVAGCCTLPGLPLSRITTAAYNPRHPHAQLLEELISTLRQQIQSSQIPDSHYWET